MSPEPDEMSSTEQSFLDKAERGLRALFAAARSHSELGFAAALNPHFRAPPSPGWSVADEAIFAVEDYLAFLTATRPSRGNVRIALAFYSQLATAPGYYEVPKNMLRVVEGMAPLRRPFDGLGVERRAPLAAGVLGVVGDLVGHASRVGQVELAEVFRDAFDSRVADGYARGHYAVGREELRFLAAADEEPVIVEIHKFESLLNRGLGFLARLFQITNEHIHVYDEPRAVHGRIEGEPETEWTVRYDPLAGALSIRPGA
jgi:hypothetical protein